MNMSDFVTVRSSKRSRSKDNIKPKLSKPAFVPLCRHCENMGLPSAHSLRSKDGELLCSVLLANKCSYCHLPGHTLKLCPELKAKHERLHSRSTFVKPVVPLTLIHPDILEPQVQVQVPVPVTVTKPIEETKDVVYTEYISQTYNKYAGRDWADISDSDEE